METTSSAPELKFKARNSFIAYYLSKDSFCTNLSNNSWPGNRENWLDHSNNSYQSNEEWNRDLSFHNRNRDNFGEDERVRSKQFQPREQLSFSNYNYNTSDQSLGNDKRRAFQMISMYDMLAANSTRCGSNPVDGMSTKNNIPVNSCAGMPLCTAANNSHCGGNPIDGMSMTENNIPLNSCAGMPLCTALDIPKTPRSGVNPFMGNYSQYGMLNAQDNVLIGAVKEIVYLSKSVLYPPNPNAPPPHTSEKPLGCKTIFIDGLPEKATKEIIEEVFERCGEFLAIRLNKKNFCHIRFANEASVEKAIYFSGYQIKIGNKDEAAYCGKLYVDYAKSKSDQSEYESRLIARQSPPPVVDYTNVRAVKIIDKLREEDTFLKAVPVVTTWLEKGNCSKKNATLFYTMIQNTNNHVRKLMKKKVEYEQELKKNEQKLIGEKIKFEQELGDKINKYQQELMEKKIEYEHELKKSKVMYEQQLQSILLQYNESLKVFDAACLQKVWDHFTKNQRKSIQLWKEQTKEIKNLYVEEILKDRIEDEMDVSDCEDNESIVKTSEDESKKYPDQLNKLHDEIDSLRCQLEAAQNEMILLPSETAQEKDLKEQQVMVLLTAVQNMKKVMLNLPQKRTLNEVDLKEDQVHKRKCLDSDEDTKYIFSD